MSNIKNDITHRNGLIDLVPKHGNAVELGVAKGDFSKLIADLRPDINLWCIDKWDDHHNYAEYLRVLERFEHSPNVLITRSNFKACLHRFKDCYFNWIYIDGYAHTGQEDGKTLSEWFPKLKSGGLFSGHDYTIKYEHTIHAVNNFRCSLDSKEVSELHITKEELPQYPSWWFYKTNPATEKQ